MTICSWDSIYGLLNNYFCKKSAETVQMEFWIAEKLQNICRKVQMICRWSFGLQKNCRIVQIFCRWNFGLQKNCRKSADCLPTNSTPSPPRSTTSPLGVGMTPSPCPALCPALPALPCLPCPLPAVRCPLPSALCPTH